MLNYLPLCLGLFFIFVGAVFALIAFESFTFYKTIKIKKMLSYFLFYLIYGIVIIGLGIIIIYLCI